MVRAIMKSMLNVFPFSLHNVMLLIIILNCSHSLFLLYFNFVILISYFLSSLLLHSHDGKLLEGYYGYMHTYMHTFWILFHLCVFTGVTILLSLTVFLNMVAETMVSAVILCQGVDACDFIGKWI